MTALGINPAAFHNLRLADNRGAHMSAHPHVQLQSQAEVPEPVLVRDVLYACQGIDGKHVAYNGAACGGLGAYEVHTGARLSVAQRHLMHKLCELGWLFRKVRDAAGAAAAAPSSGGGAVRQAFCAVLQAELADYYRLVAILEVQAQQPLPGPETLQQTLAGGGSGGTSGGSALGAGFGDLSALSPAGAGGHQPLPYLTLRRLAVWLAEPLLRLRLLAALADGTAGKQGGALIAAIAGCAKHGDAAAAELITHALQAASVPLFEALRCWLLEGRLPGGSEFFITKLRTGAGSDVWQAGYRLEPAMLPPFVSPALAHTILRTGKSANFLRDCCKDTEWVDDTALAAVAAAAGQLAYGQEAELEATVAAAAAYFDRRLMAAMFQRYGVERHCDGIKRYLLLGQGDFVQSLMDVIEDDLNLPAGEVSEYQLNGSLGAAIQASNAQYDDPDILGRLRVRLAQGSAAETGWDVFTLEYEVVPPLATVLTSAAMKGYLRIFRLLWELKHVEHRLSAAWQLLNSCQRHLAAIATASRRLGHTCPGAAGVEAPLRQCHALRSDMAHLTGALQHYIMLEVLEAAWTDFVGQLKSAGNLDELIEVHQSYVETVLRAALLDEAAAASSGSGEAGGGLQHRLRGVLQAMLDLLAPIRRLHDAVAAAALEVRNRVRLVDRRQEAGAWGLTEADQPLTGVAEELLQDVNVVLAAVSAAYRTRHGAFLQTLPAQAHVDLRFLMFRLDVGKAATAPTP